MEPTSKVNPIWSSMQQRKDIQERILSVVGDGEILFIVPPVGNIYDVALGVHVLQSLAKQKGYKADILYLNIVLASLIGTPKYETLQAAPEFWLIGERLFARSAHKLPPLGKNPESCTHEAMSISAKKPHKKMFYEPNTFDLTSFSETEQICTAFVEEVSAILSALNYKIIGCTAMEGQTNCSIALLTKIKTHCPDTITILGGANCEGEMAEGIASLSQDINYVFSGESEIAFLSFLENYESDQLPSERVISGELLRDLDRLPLPDYEMFSHQYTSFLGDEALPKKRIGYETSRGCWWGEKQKCRFCGLYTITYREKSITAVERDLVQIQEQYPKNMLVMADNIMPPSYPEPLLLKRKKAELPRMAYQVKSNLTLQILIKLKEAHIYAVLPGIEAFSTNLLQLMNKGASGWRNLLLLRNAKCVGIYLDWFMLWGVPGDRLSDYTQLLNILPLIRHLQPPRRFVHMLLMRFSPYVQHQQDFDIRNVRPWAAYEMVYPEWADIKKLANFYIGDYPCEAHENPETIRKIADEVAFWKQSWKKTTLTMIPVADQYVIYDNRMICGENNKYFLDCSRAKEIMTCRKYDNSEHVAWAVEEKLGIVVDSWYVPLVTAAPELLLEFEGDTTTN